MARWFTRGLLPLWLMLAALAVCQSSVHWNDNRADDDLFAWHGWLLAGGAVPYRDFWDNKPPGIWLVNAGAVTACGTGAAASIAVGAAGQAISLLAFIGAARLLYGRRYTLAAAVAAAITLTPGLCEAGANRTETWVTAYQTLGFYAALRAARRERGATAWWLVAGMACGLAPWFKQSGVAAGLAILLLLPASRAGRRGSLAYLVGGVLPAAGFITWLAGNGALGDAWFAVGPFNRAYVEAGAASWWPGSAGATALRQGLAPLHGLLLLACLGAALGLAGRERTRRPVCAAVLWAVLAAYLAAAGPGKLAYHFQPMLPPLGLLALGPVFAVLGARGSVVRTVRRRGLTVIPLLACGAALVPLVGDTAARAQAAWAAKGHWLALDFVEAPLSRQQGRWVARHTRPEELIYVWGWSPGVYRVAARRAPTRFATLEKLGQVGDGAAFILREAVRDVQARPPRVFAIGVADDQRLHEEAATSGGWSAAFADWLSRRYLREDEPIGGMRMYLRRD